MLQFKRSGDVFARRVPRWKRCVDVVGSLALIVMASPAMIATALHIKLVSRGPILFKQRRIGIGGREFTMWKFRTMQQSPKAESRHREYMAELIRGNGAAMPMAKLDEDNPSIIPLGTFLRKSCIDELPQLFNVLAGEMSIVGPRPVIPYEVMEFLPWHFGRFDVLPGLTGLWQVRGKNSLSFIEMIRLDVRYARNLSPALDLEIMVRTPMVILGQLTGRADALGTGQAAAAKSRSMPSSAMTAPPGRDTIARAR
jgi:lipopolysaccharide/colanic/teichoic acid biosynthesis glycosyltransferase